QVALDRGGCDRRGTVVVVLGVGDELRLGRGPGDGAVRRGDRGDDHLGGQVEQPGRCVVVVAGLGAGVLGRVARASVVAGIRGAGGGGYATAGVMGVGDVGFPVAAGGQCGERLGLG